MPPLQDITHRFLSPLPPSSPALSYIDESCGNEYNKAEPSSAFLALSTSSKAFPRLEILDDKSDDELVFDKENKENLPPFELEDEFNPLPGPDGPSTSAAVLFSTPKKSKPKADGSPPSSDPFGFLAVERKLKLERNQAKRSISGRREPEPEPKRQKLGSRSTPTAHALPRVTPAKKILRSAKLKTQTPVARHAVDVRTLSPPAASPFHDQGRKRRRDTLSFDDGNPFVDSPHASTPSPSKRHRSPLQSTVVLFDKEDDVDDENVPPSPIVQKKKSGVSGTKNKRKRVRTAEDEDVGNQTLSALAHDPQLLANILQSRLPKRRVRQRTEAVTKPAQRGGSRRKKREEEAVDEDEQEIEKGEEQGKRRSSRLAVRESRETGSSKAGNEEIKKTTSKKPMRKTKGKENSEKKLKPSSSHIGTTTRATRSKKSASKAKEEPQHDQNSDDAKEKWGREREARRAYFEKLDSYELETENIYVI
ncbi:hypothetical protein M378DRAFT_25849 [Amanita muscaria Koide BX008]|uniref:Uncharacterized protein n=1 Tax=Amanita muscaria (strain Koide BX008) TaxID=946122 RepID=A0A0C2SFW9_AMAMK|nr:hypothetical protein M378DRAFT_25849 [Amanita muscaria Koide BX008]